MTEPVSFEAGQAQPRGLRRSSTLASGGTDAGLSDPAIAVKTTADRQVAHWASATARLSLDNLASPEAWSRLERYLGMSLRRHLQEIIERLSREATALSAAQRAADTPTSMLAAHRQLLAFRRRYLRTELTLDFFSDAINARTNPNTGALLRACDTLAHRAMAQLLDPLDHVTPPVLCYSDDGIGASILKAGLRLWDGGKLNPVAAIKMVWHNMLRPTSLFHEVGHQIAHITDWNGELAVTLANGLGANRELALTWAGWASEIAGDAFAFAHSGFASVAALHDVVGGEPEMVFRFAPGDPHPIAYLRVLLGVEMCRYFYGTGPWDDMAVYWNAVYAPGLLSSRGPARQSRALVRDSLAVLPKVVELTLDTPMKAFKGRSLRSIIQPERVSPRALEDLAQRIGPALFTSAHWIWTEPIRIVALTGMEAVRQPSEFQRILRIQEECMLRLGGALRAE